jgi:hypothetical protein
MLDVHAHSVDHLPMLDILWHEEIAYHMAFPAVDSTPPH